MVLTFLVKLEGQKKESKGIFIVNLNKQDELEIFCSNLQILTKRDKDKTMLTIIRAMLNFPLSKPINASLLAKTVALNRITVLHHLNRLEKIGLLKKEKSRYYFIEHGFSKFVLKAKEEADKIFDEVFAIAQKLDQKYYLK
ncbi:MAG: hypothetical protein ACK4J0_02400 [Candidatus Anstonellaceae archaeon]